MSEQPEMQVRQIRPGDAPQVQSLINTIMEGEFSAARAAYAAFDLHDPDAYYGGSKDLFLVAEKDGQIVGTVAIKQDTPDTALLRRVFVRRDFRGRGYGEKLLRQALDFCFQRGYHTVTFRGTEAMQGALRLCMKQGFQEQTVSGPPEFRIFVLTKKLGPAVPGGA